MFLVSIILCTGVRCPIWEILGLGFERDVRLAREIVQKSFVNKLTSATS